MSEAMFNYLTVELLDHNYPCPPSLYMFYSQSMACSNTVGIQNANLKTF